MDNSHPAGAQAQLQIRVISTDSFQITSVRWRHPDRFQAAPDLRPHRAPPAVIERRLLQHLQPPQLRQPDKLPHLASVRAGDADAEQLSGKRRPERRPQSAVPDRRPPVDPAGAQASVLNNLRVMSRRFYDEPIQKTKGQLTTACWRQAADSIRQQCASCDVYYGTNRVLET